MKVKPDLLLKKSSLLLLLIAILTVGSCKKDQQRAVQPIKTESNVVAYIKKLGFKQSDISESGNYYVVEGDILFSKTAIIDTTKTKLDINPTPSSRLKTEQTGAGTYVGANINVIIQVDPSMNNYVNEITSAIGQWNSVPGGLRFSIYNGTGALPNVTIKNVNLYGSCGQAEWPFNGQPGSLVQIDEAHMAQYSFAQRQINIAHELGHVIGLRHTNWYIRGETTNGIDDFGHPTGAVQIPGTPDQFTGDPNSIMNGGLCGQDPITLSNFDKLAFQFLYPVPEVVLPTNVSDVDADNNLVGYVEYDFSQPYLGPPTQSWPTNANFPLPQFFPYQGSPSNSFDITKGQLNIGNAQISNYTEPNQTLQIYTNSGGAASSTLVSQAVGYLNYALTHGFPVIVGVRNGAGYTGGPNHDQSTNHFVVLVDVGSDSNGNFYRFYDNSTSFASKGANILNKLYYNSTTRIISGSSQSSYCVGGYIVTQVRKSKGTD